PISSHRRELDGRHRVCSQNLACADDRNTGRRVGNDYRLRPVLRDSLRNLSSAPLQKNMPRIPLAMPDLLGNEETYVLEPLRSSWVSATGPFLDRFEKSFAELCGTSAAVGVCNGTVALHLALLALDVRQGDEVLVPSMTYIATANAVRYVGAEPVFVDVDPK